MVCSLPPIDSFAAAKLREAMVFQLITRGAVRSAAVAEAFRKVPRHFFVPAVSLREAYADQVIQTKAEGGEPMSTLSQPTAIATMLEQLELLPGMRALEIGAGSGYNAALLAEIVEGKGAAVTSVDIDPDMVGRARRALAASGYDSVEVRQGDGFTFTTERPVDRIELSVESPCISPAWVKSLLPGGLLLLPLRIKGIQYITPAFVLDRGHLESKTVSGCAFMPLRGKAPGITPRFRLPGADDVWFIWEGRDEFPAGALGRAFKGKREEHELGDLPIAGLAYAVLMDELAFSVAPKRGELGQGPISGFCDPDSGSVCLISGSRRSDNLSVESYSGSGAVGRLLSGLEGWNRAGRPGPEKLHIMAYPKGSAPEPQTGWRFIVKPFFDLLISYQSRD